MSNMTRIKKLSLEVQSTLRSGISIVDVTHCVSELVQNSLDAKATSIAIRIDLENFILQVIDNGQGLTKEELDVLGERYMTSKCRSIKDLKKNLPYYGFRGESIASIIEACSVLLIVSKPEGCEQTYSKVFRGNKERNNAVVSTHNRLCTGTTIVVKGFLHNLPVRRARIQPAMEMESVRHCLIALSIINHKVSFTLRNDVTKLVILQTQEFSSCEDAVNYHCNLKEIHGLITVTLEEYPFTVTLHISKETEPTGNFKFIYVNGRLVKNKRIYEVANKHLAKSFSMRNIGKEVKGNDDKPREKSFPVFVIHIQCPFSEYDIVGDPRKVKVEFKKWDVVDKSLENVIRKFVVSDNALYAMPEEGVDTEQKTEHNLEAANIASHDDHVVKSNVLCGKSVSRPCPLEDTIETNNDETIRNPVVPEELENKTMGNKELADMCEIKLNRVKMVSDSNNPSCCLQLENSCRKENTSYKETMVNCNERNTNYISFASAETELAVYNKSKVKQRLNDQDAHINTNTSHTTNESNNYCIESKVKSRVHFKAPKAFGVRIKRKHLTDHILTESETDVTVVKKKRRKDTLEGNPSVFNNVSQKSIVHTSVNNRSVKKYLTEHILTESESNSFYKAPRAKPTFLKKSKLTEHILTTEQSESEISSAVKITSSFPSEEQKDVHNKNSILPIVSHDFYNDALRNMCQIQNIYDSLIKHSCIETPRKTLQVKLSRSLKKIPKTNALKLTQKHTLEYIDNPKFTCSKGMNSNLHSKELSSIFKSDNQINDPTSKLDPERVCKPEEKISPNKTFHFKLKGRKDTLEGNPSVFNNVSQKSIVHTSVNNRSVKKYLTEHILTESESNSFYKAPRAKPTFLKKSKLTEHILTTEQSESEISSAVKITSSFPSEEQKDVHNKNSILPIVSHDFYNDALRNMCQIQNIYDSLIKHSRIETPRKTLQVKLSRSLKKIPKTNALKLTQKHTLEYIDNHKFTCSKGMNSNLHSKELSSIFKSDNQINDPTSKLDPERVFKPEEKISPNKTFYLKGANNKYVTSDRNKRGWNWFSQTFGNVKTTTTRKKISGLNSMKAPAKPCLQIKRVKASSNIEGDSLTNKVKFSKTTRHLPMPKKNIDISTLNQCIKGKSEKPKNKTEEVKKAYKSLHAETLVSNMPHHNDTYTEIKPDSINCCSKKGKLGSNYNYLSNKKHHEQFEELPFVSKKSQTYHTVNEFPSPDTLYSTPTIAYNTGKNVHFTSDTKNETQRSGYLNEPLEYLDTSTNIPCTVDKQTDFSLIPTVFNSYSQKSFNPNHSFWTKSTPIMKSNESFNCKPTDKDGFAPSSWKTSYRSEIANKCLKSNHKFKYNFFQPVKDFAAEESIESTPFKRPINNITASHHDLSNGLKYHEEKYHWFAPEQFGKSQHNKNYSESNPFEVDGNRIIEHSKYQSAETFDSIIKPSIHSQKNLKSCPYNSKSIDRNIDCDEQKSFNSNTKPTCDKQHIFETKLNQSLDNTKTNCTTASNKTILDVPLLHQQTMLESDNVFHSDSLREESKNITSPIDKTTGKSPLCENVENNKQINTTNWNKEITSSGKVFYINHFTGMSSFTTPLFKDSDKAFNMENRHWFMPKGVSPMLIANENLKKSKKPLSEAEKRVVDSIIHANNVELASIKWRDGSSNTNKGSNGVFNIMNENENLANQILPSIEFKKPCVFSSESLSEAEVLGQVDKKFIAALLRPNGKNNLVLVLFDQHAVDERINLESLISECQPGVAV
ncbi:uncharacterized protein LOC128988896 isoform X2 [Macrosteles quadrilineatus]|uniref:uncharacterized protein LOC128988896 isoform X2 n=1 Tax=Macrosteles quadrilineatus TaxID=74068 RepID=UPI0023E1E806|nr:uncharacterized protein LOC128988896 isoform X2 [Macrosteles quadrilineatus]